MPTLSENNSKGCGRAKNSLFAWRSVFAAMAAISVFAWFAFAGWHSARAETIYRWVDKEGVVHYGNAPPLQGEYEIISKSAERAPEEPGQGEGVDAPKEPGQGEGVDAPKDMPSPPAPPPPSSGPDRDRQPAEQATVVPVSISKNFTMVDLQTESSWRPDSDRLAPSPPSELLAEPEYEGRSRLYGKLNIGTFPDKVYTFAFDLVDGPHPVLYFDKNGNRDLTDDGGPIASQRPGIFGADIRIPISSLIKEMDSDRDYHMWLFTNDSMWDKGYAAHYSTTQFKGKVEIDGKSYTAYIVEQGYNDADFTNDGIRLDLNGDGKIDGRTEIVGPGNVVEIEGRQYLFDIDW